MRISNGLFVTQQVDYISISFVDPFSYHTSAESIGLKMHLKTEQQFL